MWPFVIERLDAHVLGHHVLRFNKNFPKHVKVYLFSGKYAYKQKYHTRTRTHTHTHVYTGYTLKNGAVSKVNKKFISHLTRTQRTPSAAATVQVSHALPAVLFLCLLRGRGASFQDGVAAGKSFLCAPF